MLCILVVMTKTVYCWNKNVQTIKLKLYKKHVQNNIIIVNKIVQNCNLAMYSRHTMFPSDNIIDKLV